MDDQAPFSPLLCTADWGEEWKKLQTARQAADDPSHWDARAKNYKGGKDPAYANRFIELAHILPGETVLDMGCGTGALALPLAQAGHRVIAADFSCGMLGVLEREREQQHIEGIETKVMSWNDDWDLHGVGFESVDVALSSRSIATADLRDSLMRLADAARRRICVTLPTSSSPRADERILSAIGVQNELGRDYLYAFSILANKGFHPEVSYIRSVRNDTYADKHEALENLGKMVSDSCGTMVPARERERAMKALGEWIEANLVENEEAGLPDEAGEPQKAFRLRDPRVVTWAFIAWNK